MNRIELGNSLIKQGTKIILQESAGSHGSIKKSQNESISELLQESAELLNEGAIGIIGAILGGIILLPIAFIGFFVIYAEIKCKIEDHKDKKEIEKLLKTDKMILLKESSNIINQYNKIIDKVKFVKYNPIVINIMNDYMSFCKKADNDLEKIDNEFCSIKTKEEFYKKKDYFKNKYNLYNKKYEAEFNKIKNKYKNIKTEWTVNTDVINDLNKYMDYFVNKYDKFYFKNTDADDYWESIDFYIRAFKNKDNSIMDDDNLYQDVYEVWDTTDESFSIKLENELFTNPFKYIKLQFNGDKPSDKDIDDEKDLK